jgi:chaperone BCS1
VRRVKELGLVDSVSTAALQGLFLYNKDDTEGAIAMVEGLTASHTRESHVGIPGHVDVNEVTSR